MYVLYILSGLDHTISRLRGIHPAAELTSRLELTSEIDLRIDLRNPGVPRLFCS